MPTPPLSDADAREAYDAWIANDKRNYLAAASLGMKASKFDGRLNIARMRGMHLSEGALGVVQSAKLSPIEARGGWLHSYDTEGKKIGATRWAAPDDGVADDDIIERIAERMSRVLAAPIIARPPPRDEGLNFIPVFDFHMGMRVGSYGTAEAVSRLKSGFRDVLDRAPPSEITVILNGGDFTEANDNSALTPQSKHPLAVDMDFSNLIDIAVDLNIDMIEFALARSDRVVYQALEANHDPAATIAIRQGLRQRYRDNPRFHMPRGQDVFTYEWEGNLIAGIHGNQKTTKPEQLTLAIAARHAVAWGAAKRRELWRGHNHKEITINVPGMRVYQVNPICPPGRYANSNMFTGESDIQCVTYRKGGGRSATTVHIFDD
jgi:hypothetical protein